MLLIIQSGIVGFVSLTLATGYAVLALAAVLIWQFSACNAAESTTAGGSYSP